MTTFEKRERIWDWVLMLTVVFSATGAGAAYATLSKSRFTEDPIGFVIFTLLVSILGWGGSMIVIKPLDSLLRRTWIKSYWIEDCGDVIKLHGSVKLTDMNRAYRDLLAGHQGFRIVSDPVGIYGCTLAAVKATQDELTAKKDLESLGFKVRTIG